VRKIAPDLKNLLTKLLESDVDFVLIGGFAATVHGSTLVTQDIDICTTITEDQVSNLRHALKDLHPIHRMNPDAQLSFLDHPSKIDGINNIYLKTDLGILDIMSESQPAGKFEEIKSRAVEIQLYSHTCWVISIDDLITIKRSMNRPKDVQTVQELELIRSKLNT